MEVNTALQVMTALADGRHPHSGDALANDTVCQDAQVIRALNLVVQVLKRQVEIENRRKTLPAKCGQSWTNTEEQDLAARFDAGICLGDLARQFSRTTGAIEARLAKLGKITLDPSSWGRSPVRVKG